MSRPTQISTDLPRTAELVIVGAGIVGAATAFHAARALLVDVLLGSVGVDGNPFRVDRTYAERERDVL